MQSILVFIQKIIANVSTELITTQWTFAKLFIGFLCLSFIVALFFMLYRDYKERHIKRLIKNRVDLTLPSMNRWIDHL